MRDEKYIIQGAEDADRLRRRVLRGEVDLEALYAAIDARATAAALRDCDREFIQHRQGGPAEGWT